MKLTETQMMFIYLGIGAAVFITFAVFVYFDYDEIDLLKQEQNKVEGEIQGALKKQSELKGLKNDLWFMKEKYEYFKQVLPKQENLENFFILFYENLEKFRKSRNMQPWNRFKIDGIYNDTLEDEEDQKKGKGSAKTPPKPAAKKGSTGPFTEYGYSASIPVTFNHLGQLLNEIENYEPFYGITQIKVGTMSAPKRKGEAQSAEMEGTVELKLINFSYSGNDPEAEQANKLLAKFKPDKNIEDKFNNQKKNWTEKNVFVWSQVSRDPFNNLQVLTPIGPKVGAEEEGKEKLAVELPKDEKALQESMKNIQAKRDRLHALAVIEAWVELENLIRELKYEVELKMMKTALNTQNDADGKMKSRIEKMLVELKEWQKLVDEASKEKKARQLVDVAENKVAKMKELYQQGKEAGSQEILEKVKQIHNEIIPEMRSYKTFEPKIKKLGDLRKSIEEYYAKADTQIKIIQMVSKIKLFGIIFMKKNPDLSIAFIDKKPVHKNDILNMGFVVHEIQETKVVLKYKEETVPVPLKRGVKTDEKKP